MVLPTSISGYLDSILSLVLVYFLLSRLVSILTERYAKLFKLRANFLQNAVYKLCQDGVVTYGHLVYTHPLVKVLNKNEKEGPSYLTAETFADAFIDVIGKSHAVFLTGQKPVSNDLYTQFKNGLAEMANGN